VGYRPGDGTDWTDPDPLSVGEALDDLAAAPGGGGSGDVVGPGSSVDDAIVLFDSTTGKLIKESDYQLITVSAVSPYAHYLKVSEDVVILYLYGTTGDADYVLISSGSGSGLVKAQGGSTDVDLLLRAKGAGKIKAENDGTDREVATISGTQTLTNKTLTTPTIGDFQNATHNHRNNAGGGTLSIGEAHVDLLSVHTEVSF
jgi:hypothetical protein